MSSGNEFILNQYIEIHLYKTSDKGLDLIIRLQYIESIDKMNNIIY